MTGRKTKQTQLLRILQELDTKAEERKTKIDSTELIRADRENR